MVFFGVFSLLVVVNILLTSSNLSSPVIRSDGEGYYLYLPSLFIHHDIAMHWTEPLRSDGGILFSLSKVRPGVYLDKYPIGMAVLWLPFFFAAHGISILIGQPANGFTMWYQGAISFATSIYGALGCAVLFSFLRRYFSPKVSYLTVMALLLGTNMLSYATYDASFTHVYSLFLIACILYLTPVWYKTMSYPLSICLATLFTLNVLVRPENILILIVVLFWNITSWAQVRQRAVLLWRQRWKVLTMLLSGLIVLFPQLAYWHHVTRHWLVFSYQGETFNFAQPHILDILFSTDRGVFFWAPVLVLSLVGLVLLWKRLKEWALALYIFLPIWLYVTSSWHSWQFGASYGHRAFIDIFPLFGLAMATVYASVKSSTVKRALAVFVGVCTVANLFLTYQYWIIVLPSTGTTIQLYLQVWQNQLNVLLSQGLASGFLGLIGIVSVTIGPLTYYFLTSKEPRARVN